MSAGQILVVGAIAFIGAAFLNSRTLLDMAERQPYGWQRTVAVGLAKPLHTVSRWTGLAKPGQAVDDARGRNSGSADSFDALTTSTVPTASSVAGALDERGLWQRGGDRCRADIRRDHRARAGDRDPVAHPDRSEAVDALGRRRLDGRRGRPIARASLARPA